MSQANLCIISDNRDFVILSADSCAKCFELSQHVTIMKRLFPSLTPEEFKTCKIYDVNPVRCLCKDLCKK